MGVASRLRRRLKSEKEMKTKIGNAIRVLDLQRRKLVQAKMGLEQKERSYFNKIVEALRAYRKKRATLFANEMAEVRKALKSINQAILVFEQISLRLGTVRDIGDVVAAIAPAVSVIRSLRGDLSNVIPKAEEEFDTLSDMLDSILVDAGQRGGLILSFSAANAEAEKILREAEKQVEGEIIERLPSVPDAEREGIRL